MHERRQQPISRHSWARRTGLVLVWLVLLALLAVTAAMAVVAAVRLVPAGGLPGQQRRLATRPAARTGAGTTPIGSPGTRVVRGVSRT